MSSSGRKSWRTASGICRCCLAEGCFKMLSGEYQWLGVKEVYQDMLLDCFGLTIAETPEQQSWSSTRLICGVCITRIRDASNFKKQVVNSEKELLKRLSASAVNALTVPKPEEPKVEAVKKEHEEYANDFLDDPIDNDGDDFNLSIKFEATKEEDDQSDSDAPLSVKRKAGTQKSVKKSKPSTQKKESKKSKTVKKLKPSSSKIPAEPIMQDERQQAVELNKRKLRNVVNVLHNSTAIPFRWDKSKFRCFICPETRFQDPGPLREHTAAEHAGTNYQVFVKHSLSSYCNTIKIDDIEVTCKICLEKNPNLETLIDHLVTKHNIDYDKSVDCLTAFNLDDFKCPTCGDKFEFFSTLIMHLNKHSNDFICECGKTFLTKKRLDNHARRWHRPDLQQCSHCDKKFATAEGKIMHEKRSHLFKCNLCTEEFTTARRRRLHMADAHNMELEHSCPNCSKSFATKSAMLIHVKQIHLKEKNVVCDVCGDKFFDKCSMKLHMVRHIGVKSLQCAFCEKKFARKTNLSIHERIHTNDRRCVCKLCGKAFIQTASLKLHLRVHHPNQI